MNERTPESFFPRGSDHDRASERSTSVFDISKLLNAAADRLNPSLTEAAVCAISSVALATLAA